MTKTQATRIKCNDYFNMSICIRANMLPQCVICTHITCINIYSILYRKILLRGCARLRTRLRERLRKLLRVEVVRLEKNGAARERGCVRLRSSRGCAAREKSLREAARVVVQDESFHPGWYSTVAQGCTLRRKRLRKVGGFVLDIIILDIILFL